MKSRGLVITLIIILSLLAVSLVGGMILLMSKKYSFGFKFNIENNNMKLIDSYETTPESINQFYLDLVDVDVSVKESNTETIKVEYYSSNKKKVSIKQEETILKIIGKEKNNICVGICMEKRKVVLYVPASYIGSYNINTVSGDIAFENDTPNSDISIKTTSGDVVLKSANNVDIRTKSGDVKNKDINKNNIKTTSGDIRINTAKAASKINTVSGDVSLSSGTKVSVDTTSGDISIDKISKSINLNTVSGDVAVSKLEILENSNIKTTSGDVYISNNNSNCYVETSTTSGDIHVTKSDRKSDLTLSINTVSGDITVR